MAGVKVNANSLVRPWCCICGAPATNKHHHPQKGIGGIGRKGIEPPVISLCGNGNMSGCHGLVHKHKIELLEQNGVWKWKRKGAQDWHPCITEMRWENE